jgi:hypothetical protein
MYPLANRMQHYYSRGHGIRSFVYLPADERYLNAGEGKRGGEIRP